MKNDLTRIFKNVEIPLERLRCFSRPKEEIKDIGYTNLYMKLYNWTQAEGNITNPIHNTTYHVYDYPNPRPLLLAYRDLLRSKFIFKDELVVQAIRNIDEGLKAFNATYYVRNIPIVTVHVRRTDYLAHLMYLFKMKPLGDWYFKNAFQFYRER